jgi:hypothetical protein
VLTACIIRAMTRRNIPEDSYLRRENVKSHFRFVIQESNLICGHMGTKLLSELEINSIASFAFFALT